MLVLGVDGSFTFDPEDDFDSLANGETTTVSFEYELSGGGETNRAVATITIIGTNDAPIVSAPLNAIVAEGTSVTVDLLEGANDIDAGDVLSVDIDTETLPAGVILDGNSLSIDAADSAYDSLGEGQSQEFVITYTILDAMGASVSQTLTLTITGTNDAPTVQAALTHKRLP